MSCPAQECGISLYLIRSSFYSSVTKFYSFLKVHLAHFYFTWCFTFLLLFITGNYIWMMFTCLFCTQTSFWALLFIFQLTVCMLIQNDYLITSLICLKILQLPFRTKSEFRDLTSIHFFRIQYISCASLCHMLGSTRDTVTSLPWRHPLLGGISVLL